MAVDILGGAPAGFGEFLDRKYRIKEMAAQSAADLAGARAENLRTQTGLAPALANATIQNSTAQTGLYGARASFLGQQQKNLALQAQPYSPFIRALAAQFTNRLRGGTPSRQRASSGSPSASGTTSPLAGDLTGYTQTSPGNYTIGVGSPGLDALRKRREELQRKLGLR